MYENDHQSGASKSPVNETCDITIRNLNNLSMTECHEALCILRAYLNDRKKHEFNRLECEIKDLHSKVKFLEEINF